MVSPLAALRYVCSETGLSGFLLICQNAAHTFTVNMDTASVHQMKARFQIPGMMALQDCVSRISHRCRKALQ